VILEDCIAADGSDKVLIVVSRTEGEDEID